MEKSNKIYLGIILVCTVLVIGLCVYAIATHKEEKLTDALKFKKEYESLNEVVNENNEKQYMEIFIDEENPIVYKTGQEIVEIMKNEDAIN